MSPHLTEQLRERIIVWHFQRQKKIAEIAQLAGCSWRSIYKILTLHRDFGQTRNPFVRRRSKPRTLNQQNLSFITFILDANPTLFLDEIQEQLLEARNVEVSIPTLSRSLHRLARTNGHQRQQQSEMSCCVQYCNMAGRNL
ncbi:uncharacterized protein EDB93DRAFT_1146396 [Suillus bovinus]|uniref:uncharacterized protein n=1 Tax=Suillus bovinus TaxID=48563 RepID=UPI001B86957C|nr:uncharacterized protein EDB93DRAFT_1146396 [Suillus bovinus]KAG2147736.1 hypothetical protein EDB93DRAFT_1146396 [Suillus bovinus]